MLPDFVYRPLQRTYMRRNAAKPHRIWAGIAAVVGGCFLTSTVASAGSDFAKRLELQGFAFDVSATNEGSINQLTVTPSGLSEQQGPVKVEIDGSVTNAEIADLDSNGFPEIYIYVTSAGSGSYGSLVGYAVNKGKSMSDIYLPPVSDDPKHNKGYMGHDEFAVVEGTFVQRFPIYKDADTNAQPTGKTRQLQYKLKAGEAGWVLRLDKAVEY
jgi:hypothetical protein